MKQSLSRALTGIVGLLAIVSLTIAQMPNAVAHAKMKTSSPADGAVVMPGLVKISLNFSDPMRLTVVKINRVGETAVDIKVSELPKAFVSSADIGVPPLTAGRYAVEWIGVGKDGHLMQGAFTFDVSEK